MSVVAPDWSQFQKFLDHTFNRRVGIFRVNFGPGYLDPRFLHNAGVAHQLHDQGRADGFILYMPYLRGYSPQAQASAVIKAVGPKPPSWLLGFEIDIESWPKSDYEQHGDHSGAINTMGGLLAHYMSSFTAVWMYANGSDFAELAPRVDRRFPVNVADYDGKVSMKLHRSQRAQQYTDGTYAPPRGLPRESMPFGRCDHNVFPGFANGAALRELMRPSPKKVAPKPVVKPKPAPVAVTIGGVWTIRSQSPSELVLTRTEKKV